LIFFMEGEVWLEVAGYADLMRGVRLPSNKYLREVFINEQLTEWFERR